MRYVLRRVETGEYDTGYGSSRNPQWTNTVSLAYKHGSISSARNEQKYHRVYGFEVEIIDLSRFEVLL